MPDSSCPTLHALLFLVMLILSACSTGRAPEATSLLDKPLHAPPLAPDTRTRFQENLARAEARFEQEAGEDNLIWVGRRLAYLGRYGDAIAVYTDGIGRFPGSYALRRHRGHRYITTRRLAEAVTDLTAAAALIQGVADRPEADGLPNQRNIPTSTSHTNIYYHLGLALYLQGEYAEAVDAYRRCMGYAANDDMRCATAYWLYLTLGRLGRDREAAEVLAPITPDMDVIENFAYRDLLLLYKGRRTPEQILGDADAPSPVGPLVDDATLGYGIGMWHLLNGRTDEARDVFEQVLSGPAWPAFGYIAAEAELEKGSGVGGQGSGKKSP